MMNRKVYISRRVYISLCIICFAILLCGCQNNQIPSNDNDNVRTYNDIDTAVKIDDNVETYDAQLLDINFESVLSYSAFVDDYIIYKTVKGNDVGLSKADIESGESFFIGTIPDFYLSMKQTAIDYPYLFFFAATINNETQEAENTLVRLNLESSQLESYPHQDDSVPGIPAYLFNGKVLTYKNVVTDDTISTYIETIDVETNDWQKVMECSLDNNTYQGDAIFGLCANEDNIYALYDKCLGPDEIETYLLVLDSNFRQAASIKVDNEIHDYVMTSFISDMQVFGDYIYLYNASNYGFLGKLEDGVFKEVFKGRNFEVSSNSSKDAPIFYTRGTNSLYFLDEDGSLAESRIRLKDDYSIMCIFESDDAYLVMCYSDGKEDCAYLLNKESTKN